MAIAAKFLVFLVVAVVAILMAESNSVVWANKANDDAKQYVRNMAINGQGSLRRYQCPSQCGRRCSRTQYKKPCLFFCNMCCSKCLCVPPGYYGNKGICPCYNNWKTKRGGPKCP